MTDKLNLDKATLIDKMDDIKIKLALLDYMDMEGKLLIEENKALQYDELFSLDEKTKKKIQKSINKYYIKNRIKKVTNIKPKNIYKVAAILIFSFIIISVSVFNVKAIKNKLFNFILDMRDEYTSIQLVPTEDTGSSNITINWKNAYVPTRIPEGYRLSSVTSNDLLKVLKYNDSNDSLIILQQFSGEGTINVDMENADSILKVFVQDSEGILVEKGYVITISWNYADYIFLMDFVKSGLSREEVLDIAESVSQANIEAE